MTSLSVENGSTCLAHRIAEAVQAATAGKVHGLQVDTTDNRIGLSGLSPSYAVKREAQEAVWRVAPNAKLTNHIVVWYPTDSGVSDEDRRCQSEETLPGG